MNGFVIGLLIVLVVLLFIFILNSLNYLKLKKIFKGGNTIVFGKKGKGKDLIFQAVIKSRKKPYYSNIPYGYKQEENINVGRINIDPNTYEGFIEGKYTPVSLPLKQDMDVYISDCGIVLPSQYDSLLSRKYPSFPIYYALSRHLTNSNIHCNTQALGRVWVKLREQTDFFIKANGVIKLPFVLVVKFTTYDRYQSALNDVRPMSSRLGNKFSKAEKDLFNSQNGEIKNGFIIIRKKSIKYDTRYFRSVLDKDYIEVSSLKS